MSAKYRPDHYLNYGELTDLLKTWAAQYPKFCELRSIGKSKEGRDLWLMTLTDSSTGPHESKPGYWVDGNMHAMELAGTQATVHLINEILSKKEEKRFKDLLKNFSIYLVPRVSPDGAEGILTRTNASRSAPLNYPHKEPKPGFYREDMNGDGKTLSMIIPDRAGRYKKSKKDPRILLRREPTENDENEVYYRALPEGRFIGESRSFKEYQDPFGLDFNRNFPHEWTPEGHQPGAGDYPLSQPETKAVADFICQHPNIFGAMNYHTFSAVVLRPSSHVPDSKMNPIDLQTYKAFGKLIEEASGYPCISIFEDFKYSASENISGTFLGWLYDQRGILGFSPEIWHMAKAAGIEIDKKKAMDWLFNETNEGVFIKIFKWIDTHLANTGAITDWKEFDHPELGKVEIGGIDPLFTVSNPPPQFLEKEMEKNVEYTLRMIESGPRVLVEDVKVEKVGESDGQPISQIEVTLNNTGFISTLGAQVAAPLKVVPPPRVKCTPSEAVSLIEGEADFEMDHLVGRSDEEFVRNPLWAQVGLFPTTNRNTKKLVWIVKGKGSLKVSVDLARGGKKEVLVEIP
ncbi:hypothetical protein GW916_13460 [bacterium]|nr:hypothetical protein [bacterium]